MSFRKSSIRRTRKTMTTQPKPAKTPAEIAKVSSSAMANELFVICRTASDEELLTKLEDVCEDVIAGRLFRVLAKNHNAPITPELIGSLYLYESSVPNADAAEESIFSLLAKNE